ncbi:UNVERIFIED_CONTAM: hypothetical protein FKN15_005958 [Acipenser sinensis]
MASSTLEQKRKLEVQDENGGEGAEDELVGPLPAEATQSKKRKGKLILEEKKKNTRIVLMTSLLEFERVYLDNLPSAAMYERSYMHRDVITHIACTKTDFIITASHDGHVKFWKKKEDAGIEFVKPGVIECIGVSAEGALFCSVGDDQAMKVFDVVNFDMINMLKLGFHPGQCEWIYNPGDAISTVACSEKSTGKIFVYDGRGDNQIIHVFEKMHSSPLSQIRLNPAYRVIVSADKAGMLEYWTGLPNEFKFPRNVDWEYKTDTDLCPKTVENFCVHSRNGYYNGHIFHRVIKGFMIQTGDPTGTGMGGESIWGGEFEDEFHATLRHDRPYTLSMANGGPGTNGSQFFITVVPTPWLDNKHTVFGRITKGMEVVQRISNVKINPKTDKPYEDISIINITVK